MMKPKLTHPNVDLCIYSRHGCPACEDMIVELEVELLGKGLDFRVVNVDEDAQLVEKYGLVVPVLSLNKRDICQHTLQTEVLRSELSKVM